VSYLFPLASMANMFAMTVLLIALGLSGNTVLAAEVGIVQGATLALFYAFSANARSLILSNSSTVSASSVMMVRMLLLTPLALVSYWLSVHVAGVAGLLAVILIVRRISEWLSEVHLSEMERLENRPFAMNYLIIQSLLLFIAFIWLVADFPLPLLGMFFWALVPLVLSFRYIHSCLSNLPKFSKEFFYKMLPHLGSTAIIGMGVYVFRLLILLLVGKETAGDLYTAFAIGGLTGSVFANSLGASIALHEQRIGKKHFPKFVSWSLYISLLLGILIFVAANLQVSLLSSLGKTFLFWQAAGLSLIGGVVMVYAQRIRFKLLQQDDEKDVYGPDVIINMLLITSIPFIYYLLGLQAMTALYLLSALFALSFYKSSELVENHSDKNHFISEKSQLLIPAMLLFPLFFQLGRGLFNDSGMYFDSGSKLLLLPIPISVIACFGGILIMGIFREVKFSLNYIFSSCLLMVVTTIVISQSVSSEDQSKFILLIQCILPMFGLVLGQVYWTKSNITTLSIEKAFLYTLLIVVPLQLISTWLQGFRYLSPYLYVFSIYQHLQYVPVIFVSAFMLAYCNLWMVPIYRKLLFVLAFIMGIYVTSSMSMLALAMLLIGVVAFAIYQWINSFDKTAAVLLLVVVLSTVGNMMYAKDVIKFKFTFLQTSSQSQIAPNVEQRLYYWKYYVSSVVSSPQTFLFGHAKPPNRTQYPSAHNYYLDLIYNFGFIALLPFIIGLLYTLRLIYRLRKEIYKSTNLLSFSTVVFFLLLVDNTLKVGLRQPYSGIFIFFLWGVLISKLLETYACKSNNINSELLVENTNTLKFAASKLD
jgi:hypothetical protein